MTYQAAERKEGEPPRLIVVSNRLPVTIKKDAKTGEYTYKVCEYPSSAVFSALHLVHLYLPTMADPFLRTCSCTFLRSSMLLIFYIF
jgi:hypothetical protein